MVELLLLLRSAASLDLTPPRLAKDLEDTVLIRPFNAATNEDLAKERYNIGLRRNLGICLLAFALLDSRPCCYIELPVDQDEAESMMFSETSLKCSIRDPLRMADSVSNALVWRLLKMSYGNFKEVPSKPHSSPPG
jgi:hypothetical protein